MSIPQSLRIIPRSVAARSHLDYFWEAVVSSARDAGVTCTEDSSLGFLAMSAFAAVIDSVLCAIDISDYAQADARLVSGPGNLPTLIPALYGKPVVWFRRSYTPLDAPLSAVFGFDTVSFTNWDEYRDLSRLSFKGEGKVVYGQREYHEEKLPGGKATRRKLVREMLRNTYGPTGMLFDQWEPLKQFWLQGLDSLAVVCVPGSNPHMLDRGQLQMMGLGVCTVSPLIMYGPCGVRPTPGVHYVCCRDDYTDLIPLINDLRLNASACRQIGEQAKQYFQQNASPRSVWEYVKTKLDSVAGCLDTWNGQGPLS